MGRNKKFGTMITQIGYSHTRVGGKLRKIQKSIMEMAQMMDDLTPKKDKR